MDIRVPSRFLVLLGLLAAPPALAALGEAEPSVARDAQALSMDRQPPSVRAGLAVHELRSATATVREYLAPDGTVVAVAWSGTAPPDLGLLLGAYAGEYRAAAAAPRAGRGPRHVETGRLVVDTWGHARALHGRAYLPSRLPAGVNLDDLR